MRLRSYSLRKRSSEISLTLLEFHGAFFIVVDGTVFPLRTPEGKHLFDNFRQRIGLGADRSRARNTSEGPHTALQSLCFFSRAELRRVVDYHDGAVSQDNFTLPRKIERHDRNLFHVDVQPDVQLSPVRKREDADAFAFIQARIEDIPQLRPLVLGVPLAEGVAEGIDAFLRA